MAKSMKKDKEANKQRKAAVIKWLKSLAAPCIVLAVILIGVLVITIWQEEPEPEEIIKVNAYEGEEKEYVLENDKIRFSMDSQTTQFTVTDKRTGENWYSNPQEADNDDLALPAEIQKLKSTLVLTYSTINGVDTIYNNYRYCVENQIYEIEEGEDYIKVFYSIGDVEKEYLIPPVITVERMEQFLENMTKSNAVMVTDYYKKYDINKLGKKDNEEELLAMYPILAQEPIYVLRDTTKDNIKSKFELYFEEAGYTPQDYAADKELDGGEKTSDKPVFNVNVIYRLDGDDLLVEIPMDEMEYKDEYPLYSLNVLPYFGAGSQQEEGYLMVPEGGGALISFNNGKIAQNSYYADCYGWDMALDRTAIVHETRTYYNVFGITKNDSAMMCILESGAPYASIQADISGRNNSYNYVNAIYNITHREQYDVADKYNGEMFVYEEQIPQESLIQRYCFVDSADYADMAAQYRDYLVNRYDMQEQEPQQTPAVIEVIGAIDKVKQIAGVPVSRPLALTSYAQAQSILEELYEEGLSNLSVKLSGWANGGVNQKVLEKIKPIADLGGKKELQALTEFANNKGIDLYLNGITNYAYDSSLKDGFFLYTDSARFVSKETVELYPYSVVTYAKRDSEDSYYLLKPQVMQEMAQNLVEKAQSLSAQVSFADIGKDLSADYNPQNAVSRQEVLNMQASLLEQAQTQGCQVMISMGNDYAIAYADIVTDMDLAGSHYTILDRQIPFYQMAIHGLVNYTGESLNLTQNFEQELLKSAEYGAGLSFTLMNESPFALQNTLYTQYFGAEYAAWHEKIVEIYTAYNQKLGHTFGMKMTGHVYAAPTVTCTTYEDGTRVYVNYGYEEAVIDDLRIPARDFVVA